MTNLIRWDPFADLRTSMDRLFDEGFTRPWRFLAPDQEMSTFPVEVSETDRQVEVKAALPGVKPEDVEVSVINDMLYIKAEHREEQKEGDEKKGYHRRELRYGSYQRTIALPVSVEPDKAEAHFRDGMLYLTLPKAESVRPKQIKVSSDGGKTIEAGKSQ